MICYGIEGQRSVIGGLGGDDISSKYYVMLHIIHHTPYIHCNGACWDDAFRLSQYTTDNIVVGMSATGGSKNFQESWPQKTFML